LLAILIKRCPNREAGKKFPQLLARLDLLRRMAIAGRLDHAEMRILDDLLPPKYMVGIEACKNIQL
jgi:hypothetical protein